MSLLLDVRNLSTSFESRGGVVHAVCGVSLSLQPGEVVALIGETGSGKSVLGQSIVGLLPSNAVIEGEVRYRGQVLTELSEKEMLGIRGHEIAYICQNPTEALNPVLKVGTQVRESVRASGGASRAEARAKGAELLEAFDFRDPEQLMGRYPFELSGGMRQRVLSAMAVSGNPGLLIADEPTKGLDALIRRGVLDTLRRFIDLTGCAALIITHDLRFAQTIADRIAVMYAGEIVEVGAAADVMGAPAHPYMEALIRSQPQYGLHVLEGSSCSLIDLPAGCRFAERCERRSEACSAHPDLIGVGGGHEVRCVCHA